MAKSQKYKKSSDFFSEIGILGGENQNRDSGSDYMTNDRNKAKRPGGKRGGSR